MSPGVNLIFCTNRLIILFLVMPAKPHMCQTMDAIQLDPSGGYIGKQTLEGTGAYLSDCIWSLQVQAGQRISFTFYSFLYGRRQNYKQSKGGCRIFLCHKYNEPALTTDIHAGCIYQGLPDGRTHMQVINYTVM